jgi:hypothetical protein
MRGRLLLGTMVMALLVGALTAPGARADGRSLLFDSALATSVPAPLDAFAPLPVPAAPPTLTLEAGSLSEGDEWLAARISGGSAPKPRKEKGKRKAAADAAPARPHRLAPVLDGRRARILLRSMTVPGWGQATAGHRTSAAVFGIAEAGVWGSFTAFRIQEALRRRTTERTASIYAGIDLAGRDEEFRRIVGSFLSSDEYNQYVVFRDAAGLYYNDPVAYRAYIAAHSLTGADTWSWGSVDQLLLYRHQRKVQQRASQRANTVLAVAIANRLLSVVHATRVAGRPAAAPRSWNLECVPAGSDDPTAFHLQVSARF